MVIKYYILNQFNILGFLFNGISFEKAHINRQILIVEETCLELISKFILRHVR